MNSLILKNHETTLHGLSSLKKYYLKLLFNKTGTFLPFLTKEYIYFPCASNNENNKC